jgi:hypothetical protein
MRLSLSLPPAGRSVLLVLAVASAGCSSPIVARVAPSLATGPQPYFVRVADALTSPTLTEPMRVAPRLFSAFQLTEACREPVRVARLEAPARDLDLRVGDRLALSTLRVVAVNDANVAVAGVPVTIEAEERNPPVVVLRSDDPDLDQGRLHLVNAGTLRVRVRTVCAAVNQELTITGQILP